MQKDKWPLRAVLASLPDAEDMDGASQPPLPRPVRRGSLDVSPSRTGSDVSSIPSYPSDSDDDDLGGPEGDFLDIQEIRAESDGEEGSSQRRYPPVRLNLGKKSRKRKCSLSLPELPSPKRSKSQDAQGQESGHDSADEGEDEEGEVIDGHGRAANGVDFDE